MPKIKFYYACFVTLTFHCNIGCFGQVDSGSSIVPWNKTSMSPTSYLQLFYNNWCIENKFGAEITSLRSVNNFRSYKYTTRKNLPRLHCESERASSHVLTIRSCPDNYTGPARVVELCEADIPREMMTLDVYNFVVDMETDFLFWNKYCAQCNGYSNNTYPTEKEKGAGDSSALFEVVPPFPQLIRFSRQVINDDTSMKESNLNQCEDTHWLSPDGTCKPLHCSPGKKLISGNCRTSNSDVTGLGYKLSTWFMLRPADVKLDQLSLKAIGDILESQMLNETNLKARNILLQYKLGTFAEGQNTGRYKVQSPLVIMADIFIVAQLEISRDDFEDFIVNKLIRTPLTIAENTEIYLVPYLKSGGLTESILIEWCRWITKHCLYERTSYSIYESKYDVLNRKDLLVKVTNTLACSFVSFSKSEYKLDVVETDFPPSVTVTVNLGNTKLIFSKVSEINMLEIDGDGVLNVCRKDLDDKLASLDKTPNELNYYANILTLTCMSASMLCLLVSLVTYIRFSELRNSAGKNNMFLCTSLLLAQASLLASSYLSGYKYFCIAFGISTHFLWVWSSAWTLVCSIRMLQMVSTKYQKPQKSAEERRTLVKNVLFTLALPTISVATVVISSQILSHGRKIGYGEINCFIDYNIHLGLCLITPLALITVCNVALFIATVVRIYTISRSVTQQDKISTSDRQLSLIYVTLSLMTGAFWLLAIVGEGTESKPLQ
ncbi:uncharacterized protein LOC131951656 [Physella acuta]|uniref:uncharacterized protein LOC131951656 n=1 Tax=Physella acuta TaxID=109671 RepID=UPI0027DE6180|nr:uncharacterized protein LOC131951656 [Physella acuta]